MVSLSLISENIQDLIIFLLEVSNAQLLQALRQK